MCSAYQSLKVKSKMQSHHIATLMRAFVKVIFVRLFVAMMLVTGTNFVASAQAGDTHVKIDIQSLQTELEKFHSCLLYTSPSPRDLSTSRMPSSA